MIILCIYASRDLVVTGMIRVSERDRCVNDVPFDFRRARRKRLRLSLYVALALTLEERLWYDTIPYWLATETIHKRRVVEKNSSLI